MRTSLQVAAVLAASVLAGWPALAQREPPVQKELRERFGFWAERYLNEPPEFTATETRQESRPGKKGFSVVREVVSRYVARRTEEVREVLSINGAQPEGKLRDNPSAQLPERVAGPLSLISRLARENQGRMRYFFAADNAEVEVSGAEVVVGYRPAEGQHLFDLDGKAVWGSGTAWVHPDDGHVIRIEEEFEYKNTRYTSAVDYMLDDAVKAWVPRQVVVRAIEKGRIQTQRIYTYEGFLPLGPARVDTADPASKPK